MKKTKRKLIWIPTIFIAVLAVSYFLYQINRGETRQSQEIKTQFAKDSAFKHDDLTDLPLLTFENDTLKKDFFVILFPGDGGWRDFIKLCAGTFAQKGVNVVGFNTLPYFDTVRTPQDIAKDIGRIVNNFGHAWKKNKFILGGYSFSAEILPFVYNAFPAELKKRVYKVFMIAPSTLADFKVSRTYHYDKSKGKRVLDELEKTDQQKFIVFCDNAKASLCKVLPANPKAKIINLNSGHLFIGKFKEASNTIVDEVIK